jgi:hypothetical protein
LRCQTDLPLHPHQSSLAVFDSIILVDRPIGPLMFGEKFASSLSDTQKRNGGRREDRHLKSRI